MNNNVINYLIGLGFTQQEINEYEYIYMNSGKFMAASLESFCYDFGSAIRLA